MCLKIRLCARLLDICRRESIHTDMRTLSYLAGITNNDIRASLHTLQFFKENSGSGSRLSSRLTADQLQSTPIGRKDKTQNIFDVGPRSSRGARARARATIRGADASTSG